MHDDDDYRNIIGKFPVRYPVYVLVIPYYGVALKDALHLQMISRVHNVENSKCYELVMNANWFNRFALNISANRYHSSCI